MITLADLIPVASSLELMHPVSGEPLGAFLSVVGYDSEQFRSATFANLKKRTLDGTLNQAESNIEVIDEHTNNILSALITGWTNDEFFGGAFSPEAALALMKNPNLNWLKQQVKEFTEKRVNFFRV
jgi:hypothetical protein